MGSQKRDSIIYGWGAATGTFGGLAGSCAADGFWPAAAVMFLISVAIGFFFGRWRDGKGMLHG